MLSTDQYLEAMDTTVGLGLAQSFQHAGHLANECAEFQSLANGVCVPLPFQMMQSF